MIEEYNFGRITINGKVYNHDIIIYQDKISSWWRVTGHQVAIKDIEDLVEKKPEIIIFGMGSPGLMKVSGDVERYLAENNIEWESLPTSEAVTRFNHLSKDKKVAGAFHLTC
jgi:hypothetical protein